MQSIMDNPATLYKLFCVCTVAVYFIFSEDTHLIGFPLNLFGGLLFICGAKVAFQTERDFQCSKIPSRYDTPPPVLCIDGWFQYTRNPMYLGMAIALLGLAILLPSYYNFAFPLIFGFISRWHFIRHEEIVLKKTFDKDYETYCAQVNRWAGRVY
mmetsp:Transcript_9969/g.15044  ORF Transcript_9969/g.15044 Transcript_9969/m.15044 type:complete len:155 (-) Transcript_9969:185-649(-)